MDMTEWRLVPRTLTAEMRATLHERVRIECRPDDREAEILNDQETWAAVLDVVPDAPAEATPDRRPPSVNESREAADPDQQWEQFWRGICTKPDGSINVEQVKRELADYSMLLSWALRVYEHVPGGECSKVNTWPSVVIGLHDDRVSELVEGALREARENGTEATQAGAVPAGWKLVPVEPTEGMVANGFESWPDPHFSRQEEWEAYEKMSGCQQSAHRARLCWAAMLAAAPQAPVADAARGEAVDIEQMTPNQKRALSKGLSALETMADLWAVEIRLADIAQRIAAVPDESERTKRIASMIEQGFIEGAYRHFLDHQDPTQQPARASEAGEAVAPIPRVHGVGRMADNPCAVLVILKAEPSDDALRAIHDRLAAPAQPTVAWVRYRSDGGFEGPIMDSDERMCDVRRKSGAWTPLYHGSAQQAVALTDAQIDAAVEEWFNGKWDAMAGDFRGRMRAAIDAALQSHSEGGQQ